MGSPYKILVDVDEKEDVKETEENGVKKEKFTLEIKTKKPSWFTHSFRKQIRKFKRLILFLVGIAFIAFFVLLHIFFMKSEHMKCTTNPPKNTWNLTVSGFECSTKLKLVSWHGNVKNIIFGYHSTHKTNDYGAMMINGTSGSIIWKQVLYSIPTDMDCHSIDINKDGIKDCFVIGQHGLLAAINVVTGKPFWYLHHRGEYQRKYIQPSLPLVTSSDFNHDYVNDLISLITSKEKQQHLVFISGMSGLVLGDRLPFPSWCTTVTSPLEIVHQDGNDYLIISCVSNATGEVWAANIHDLHATVRQMTWKNIHSPLFYKLFRCEKSTTSLSLFKASKGQILAVCNSGEVASLQVQEQKVLWRSIVPYTTHKRVIGTKSQITNEDLATVWNLRNNTKSVVVGVNVLTGKIEWERIFEDRSISEIIPYSTKGVGIEYIVKSTNCHHVSLLEEDAFRSLCHCSDKIHGFTPKTKPVTLISGGLSRFFNATRECKMKKSLSDVISGDILGDGSQQALVLKRFSRDETTDFKFSLMFEMTRLKPVEKC